MNIHCFISSIFFSAFLFSLPFFSRPSIVFPSWFTKTDFDFRFILCMPQNSIRFKDFQQTFPVQWSSNRRCCLALSICEFRFFSAIVAQHDQAMLNGLFIFFYYKRATIHLHMQSKQFKEAVEKYEFNNSSLAGTYQLSRYRESFDW